MHFQAVLIHHSPGARPAPATVQEFARTRGLQVVSVRTNEEALALVSRSFPACLLTDGSGPEESIDLCRRLKSDAFSAIVPVIFSVDGERPALVLRGLEAGADEVLTDGMDERERILRLQMTLHRADRDVSVNPSTRLPGTAQIERDIGERMRSGELFAVCYADLDHFKEFNDRYGYNEGDRVILLLSRILRDLVKAHAPDGFIGHIGGDDFIFTLPLERMPACCEDIIEVFDELIPFQYAEEDRRLGYFLGKDRRGNILQIPIMTLSIGVVTNQYRRFTHTARVSELATEMKSYAKTLKGSVYAVDRRRDAPVEMVGSVASAGPRVEGRRET